MTGIVSYEVYVPRHRPQRAAVAAAVGGGPRSVASHDQDAVTLVVEASRAAMSSRACPDVGRLYSAATSSGIRPRPPADVFSWDPI
jgi:3-hydroxy-3-methylglutaryl CoA synthase